MAITVNWATDQVINVPQADLTLDRTEPVSGLDVYKFNIDTFRKDLRTLEASVEGQPWTDTHTHNTTITISGQVFARAVIFLAPYSIEFEDGQYVVELEGGNTNLLDRRVANQVSVVPQNSAGLTVPDSSDATLLRKLFTNRAEITVNGDTTRTIDLYDDDQTTIIESLTISATGLTRTNP